MKWTTLVLASLLSIAALAAERNFVLMHPGMFRAEKDESALSNLKGEMSCELHKTEVKPDGKLGASQMLASQRLGTPNVGSYFSGRVQFPAPFQRFAVGFNHARVGYAETGAALMPYLQAFFMVDGLPDITHWGSQNELRFSIENVQNDSKLILRGFFSASKEAMLTYNCTMRFLN